MRNSNFNHPLHYYISDPVRTALIYFLLSSEIVIQEVQNSEPFFLTTILIITTFFSLFNIRLVSSCNVNNKNQVLLLLFNFYFFNIFIYLLLFLSGLWGFDFNSFLFISPLAIRILLILPSFFRLIYLCLFKRYVLKYKNISINSKFIQFREAFLLVLYNYMYNYNAEHRNFKVNQRIKSKIFQVCLFDIAIIVAITMNFFNKNNL